MKVFQRDIFGNDIEIKNKHSNYNSFVDKFKIKKTTDDCYTPPYVYNCVRKWVNDNILNLEGIEIVRPFYPGGDYENFSYPENCLVLDNPPFSIIAKIRRFFHQQGIKYFLFAPALTLASSSKLISEKTTNIIVGAEIIYENGAKIPTSFVTNLETETGIWISGDLYTQLNESQNIREKELPKYIYPANVVSSAKLNTLSKKGVELKIGKDSMEIISQLESQKKIGKTIFGCGWLISDKAAASVLAASVPKEAIKFELEEREKEIIKKLK